MSSGARASPQCRAVSETLAGRSPSSELGGVASGVNGSLPHLHTVDASSIVRYASHNALSGLRDATRSPAQTTVLDLLTPVGPLTSFLFSHRSLPFLLQG